MRRLSTLVAGGILAIGFVCFSGCPDFKYEIELVPNGEEIERTLTATSKNEKKPFSQDELERLAALYSARPISPDGKQHRFGGRFGEVLPDDIGGKGTYTFKATSLGSAAIYLERFQGSDDLDEQIDKRRAAADEFTDIILGWFQEQLPKGSAADKVNRFLDAQFRRDLRNLGHYVWLSAMSAVVRFTDANTPSELRDPIDQMQDLSIGEVPARTVQYFVERGYVHLHELPRLTRSDAFPEALTLAHRNLVQKAGLNPEEAAQLDFLLDPQIVLQSWEDYVQRTPAFTRITQEWQLQPPEERDSSPPVAVNVSSDLLRQAAGWYLDVDQDTLDIRLKTATEPVYTNGRWNSDTQEVTWATIVGPTLGSCPPIACAVWSNPDEEFQMAHFGSVVLRGSKLAQFVFWFASLTDDEARQWDAFVEHQTPKMSLFSKLRQFDFSPKSDRMNNDVRDLFRIDP